MRISRGACTTLGYDPPCYVNRDFSINNVRALRGGTLENAVKREKKARKMNPAAVNRVERNARIDTHTHTRVRAHAHCLSLSLSRRVDVCAWKARNTRGREEERERGDEERAYVRTYVRTECNTRQNWSVRKRRVASCCWQATNPLAAACTPGRRACPLP